MQDLPELQGSPAPVSLREQTVSRSVAPQSVAPQSVALQSGAPLGFEDLLGSEIARVISLATVRTPAEENLSESEVRLAAEVVRAAVTFPVGMIVPVAVDAPWAREETTSSGFATAVVDEPATRFYPLDITSFALISILRDLLIWNPCGHKPRFTGPHGVRVTDQRAVIGSAVCGRLSGEV